MVIIMIMMTMLMIMLIIDDNDDLDENASTACVFMPLFVSVKFEEDHKTAYKYVVRSGHLPFWGYYCI